MRLISFALLSLMIASCGKRERETNYTYEITNLKSSYLALMNIANEEAVAEFTPLSEAINNFTSSFTITHLEMSKDLWRKSQKAMINLHPFLPETTNSESPFFALSSTLNQRAIYPDYIDYTQGSPGSGFINDPGTYPTLSESVLLELNQSGGIGRIALGMHAIEFMLWGEDLSPDTNEGSRLISDFLTGTPNGERRKLYLKSLATLLKTELIEAKISDTYRASFMNLSNDESMRLILSNVYRFCIDDFAGRILHEPYMSQDQKDEFSPFSDNSIDDIKSYYRALKNVLYGRPYLDDTNGYFLMDFLNEHFSDDYRTIDDNIQVIETSIYSFDETLFEKAIVNTNDRARINNVYIALDQIGVALISVSEKLGASF